ncbi:MAG: hypothetical protein AMXMBFR84_49300 [Candidatus Hydrogenedentota bacterium]
MRKRCWWAVLYFLTGSFAVESQMQDWPTRLGDPGGTRYSELNQINRENIGRLAVAWTYHTGDAAEGTNIECTPVAISGRLYLTTADAKVACVDGDSGNELWRFDTMAVPKPKAYREAGHGMRGLNRGVGYWTDGSEERILYATCGGWFFSVDAKSGLPDRAFGTDGMVDLRDGIEWDTSAVFYGVTSPPTIFENLAILGFANGEGGPPQAPGDIRAFDVRTGAEVWRFHTVPRPGEYGHEQWPGDTWKQRGGANAWGGLTLDVKRAMVFAGTGSTGFDYLGGDRPGANLYGNCVLALNARTGERVWHFQTVHHDIWDLDIPCPPMLVTIDRDGARIDAVAQVSKTGFVYVLNRDTGESLFPIEERPVASAEGTPESAYPTQPFPLSPPPFSRQRYDEAAIPTWSAEAETFVREQLKTLRHGDIFTPAGHSGTIYLPGLHGGATWAAASYDPRTQRLFVGANNIPWLAKVDEAGIATQSRFVDPQGYPAIQPPWGTFNCLNLAKGTLEWQTPFGEYPELMEKGIAPTGTENFGNSICTAGGVVFASGTKDAKFRAMHPDTGKVLWEHQLEAGAYAGPATYMTGGRQFIVVAAGGGGKLGTPSGDAYVAFALPE